ncbi:MAG: rRNA maturation RNase YbeY [Patescibacteria group bacterium]|nr:rRNA maturation RNase YbeY [Patescibacteria group bacterium]
MHKKSATKKSSGRNFTLVPPAEKKWHDLLYGIPFPRIKEKVLGKKYELSVSFVPSGTIRVLNRKYRQKDAATDILSFGLSKNFGELYICMPEAEKKSRLFGMSLTGYLGYLFIHGLLHLEGMDHGRTMSRLERKFCRALGISHPQD